MHTVIKNMEKVHHNAGVTKEVEKEEEEEEANKEEVVNEEDRKARRESRETRSKQVLQENKEVELEQMACLLGVALIASSEHIGNDMVVRQFNHLYQFGDL